MTTCVLIVDDSALVRQILRETRDSVGDGATDLIETKHTGSATLAQDGATSSVRDMSASTHRPAATDEPPPLGSMCATILDRARTLDSTTTFRSIEV